MCDTMESTENCRHINILILNPYNSALSSINLNCDFGASDTVLDLKKHIEKEYPTNPAVHNQRLIYFGKFLEDSIFLTTLFQKSDLNEPQTIHLLIQNALMENKQVNYSALEIDPTELAQSSPELSGSVLQGKSEHQQIRSKLPILEEQPSVTQEEISGPFSFNERVTEELRTACEPRRSFRHHTRNTAMAEIVNTVEYSALHQADTDNTNERASVCVGSSINMDSLFRESNGVKNYPFDVINAKDCVRDSNGGKFTSNMKKPNDLSDKEDMEKEASSPRDIQELISDMQRCNAELMSAIEVSQRVQTQYQQTLLSSQLGNLNFFNVYGFHPVGSPNSTDAESAFSNNRLCNPNTGTSPSDDHSTQNCVRPLAPRGANAEVNNRVEAVNAEGDHAAAADDQPNAAQLVVVNFRLLLKFFFVMYILNNDFFSPWLYVLLTLASLYYIFNMGYLESFVGTPEQYSGISERLSEMSRISPVSVYPPRIFTELYYFLKTLVLSIFPFYHVATGADV